MNFKQKPQLFVMIIELDGLHNAENRASEDFGHVEIIRNFVAI